MRTIEFFIRKNAMKHTVVPVILAVLLIFLFVHIPFSQIFNPKELSSVWDVGVSYTVGTRYVTATIDEAYYTGYDVVKGNDTVYSYYYSIDDDRCIFFAIKSRDDVLTNYTITGRLLKDDSTYMAMIESFSGDLNWKSDSLLKHSMSVVISEPDYHPKLYTYIMIALIIMLVICSMYILINILYVFVPTMYPAYIGRNPKNNRRLFARVSGELKNSRIYTIGSVYITEKYLVDTGLHKISIVPLSKIVWVYRLGSTRIFPGNKNASYSVYFHLLNGKKIILQNQSDGSSDNIIRALQSLNYDIIYGDTENKRRQANEIIKSRH